MAFTTITDDELVDLGVTGLADTPELSTEDMQAQFDEYPQFLKDKFKTHITELETNTAAADIGIEIPTSLQDEVSTEMIQDVVDEMASRIQDQQDWQDATATSITTASLTATAISSDDIDATEIDTAAFHADASTVTAPTVDTLDVSTNVATTEFVDNKMQAIGAGDMAKSVYDPNDRAIVETAYQVGDSYVNDITTSSDTYPTLTAGETIKVFFGKIKKYLTDLKDTVATTTSSGMMSASDKTKLDDITPEAQSPVYGTCTTAASTAAKVITLTDANWQLRAGSIIGVKFSNTNTASNPTFNVNGKGAKSVWYDSELITTSNKSYAGYSGRPMLFMYDGTKYIFVGWSKDYSSDIATLSGEVEDLQDDMDMIIGGSNDEYDSTRDYNVGDLAIYDNTLYKCITACTAASFLINASKFRSTTLEAEVSALNNDSVALKKDVRYYATCDSAASSISKYATTEQSGFSLVEGAKVSIKFDYANTASSCTLSVNSTGSYAIKANGSTTPEVWWEAGDVVDFTFDGSYWIMQPSQGMVETLNSSLPISATFTGTTNPAGLVALSDHRKVIYAKCTNHPTAHSIVLIDDYNDSQTCFKVLSGADMRAIASTSVTIDYVYIP